jgi:hypothetical protein
MENCLEPDVSCSWPEAVRQYVSISVCQQKPIKWEMGHGKWQMASHFTSPIIHLPFFTEELKY